MEEKRTVTGRSHATVVLVLSGIVLAAAAMLFLFNPAEHGFYPSCTFHVATGLDCPGCGGLRATHQLLHGNLRAAFDLNPLAVLLLPVAAWIGIAQLVRWMTGRSLFNPFNRPAWLWALGAALVVFGIARNLPL